MTASNELRQLNSESFVYIRKVIKNLLKDYDLTKHLTNDIDCDKITKHIHHLMLEEGLTYLYSAKSNPDRQIYASMTRWYYIFKKYSNLLISEHQRFEVRHFNSRFALFVRYNTNGGDNINGWVFAHVKLDRVVAITNESPDSPIIFDKLKDRNDSGITQFIKFLYHGTGSVVGSSSY